MTTQVEYEIDLDAQLWFGWDWTNWLAAGQSIQSCQYIVEAGLTELDSEVASPLTKIQLSVTAGGEVGEQFSVTYRITTNDGEIDDRTQLFTLVEK